MNGKYFSSAEREAQNSNKHVDVALRQCPQRVLGHKLVEIRAYATGVPVNAAAGIQKTSQCFVRNFPARFQRGHKTKILLIVFRFGLCAAARRIVVVNSEITYCTWLISNLTTAGDN
ncbi:hypothetical protein D3C87_1445910 [compost metagenome]